MAASSECAEKEARADGRRDRGRSRVLQRMLVLWVPRARRLVLERVNVDGVDQGKAPGNWTVAAQGREA